MGRADDPGPPLDAMCDDIAERYHAALHRSLPRIRDELSALCRSVSTRAMREVAIAFGELADQIESHLAKEENLLFPALESLAEADRAGGPPPILAFSTILHPIRLLEAEHVRIEAALDRLREAALEVGEPDSLSPSFGRCMTELAQLDADLREHHRIENEVLFPHAIAVERRLHEVG